MRPIHLLASCLIAVSLLVGIARADTGKIEIYVVGKQPDRPMPCRIHLKDATGKAQRPEGLPFFFDHFVCDGSASLTLAPGTYTYEVERGPEYAPVSGKVTIKENDTAKLKVALDRLANLPAEGWWPGETHVHRSVEQVELLMRAEDLHVAPVITWWNARNQWAQKRTPDKLLNQFDGNRYYHVMAGEDEREGGALLFFNLSAPLAITGASREYPSPSKFLGEARRQNKNVWVDIEKPFWWDVPLWLASGQVDSIGLANNHMCRSQMSEKEAWGKPRDTERLPAPRGNGYWTQEIYYHILNTGLRLPPSAGSASGVLPNPVGYNRVYVHVDPDRFGYDAWWEGLRAGRCFVTNGPLLRVEAAGKRPGHVFTADAGAEVEAEIKAQLTSSDPIRFLEIVQNGQVTRKVPFEEWKKSGSLGKVKFKSSGWFLVRAITDNPKTFRFASTGPYYVEIGPTKRRISKASVQFFVDWVKERADRVKLEDPEQRKEVLEYHGAAEKFWREKLSAANAE